MRSINSILFVIISSASSIALSNPPAACADFSGSYKAIGEPTVPVITMKQHKCEALDFSFDKTDLHFFLDAQSRVLKNDVLLKVVQSGKINKKYMMIFLGVSYIDSKGSHDKNSIILFEKSANGDVWVTFKGDVPDQVVAEKKYQLQRQ